MSPKSELSALSLRERLKTETRPEHEELETQMAILSPDLSQDRYFEILEKFFALHILIENELTTNADELATDYIENRRKSVFLISDLEGRKKGALNLNPNLHWMNDSAELLGALYVIEGSTLGGQVVSKSLHERYPGLPVRYFSGYRAETGKMWQSFISRLTQVPREKEDSVVRGAQKMFATFLQILPR